MRGVVEAFSSTAWTTMVTGIVATAQPCSDTRTAMTREDLQVMVEYCGNFMSVLPLKIALIFGFFGYLRISSLAPEKASSIDPSRATMWTDVKPKKEGIMLLLKWMKTLQSQRGRTPVPLPVLPGSPLCPVKAWGQYSAALQQVKDGATTPLLLATTSPSGWLITLSKL